MLVNKKFVLPILLAGLMLMTASCAVKSRDESNATTGNNNTVTNSIAETLQLDMQQLLSLAQAFDFATLHSLNVPASGCTGSACVAVTESCDIFSQAEFIISSYYVKKDNYVAAGLDVTQVEAAINAIEVATYSDGTSVQSILNNTDALSNLRSVCSVLISSTTLLLQNQMAQLQVQMASMQQTLISAVANGIPGPTGVTGPAGATGAMGGTGPQGPAGPAGSPGTIGHTGANGATGPTGPQGQHGTNGTNGSNGTNGANGATGANGANGATGAIGATGATGSQGPESCFRTGTCGSTNPPVGHGWSCTTGVWFAAGTSVAGCPDADFTTFSNLVP